MDGTKLLQNKQIYKHNVHIFIARKDQIRIRREGRHIKKNVNRKVPKCQVPCLLILLQDPVKGTTQSLLKDGSILPFQG